MKKKILFNCKNCRGIYILTNKINGKQYVGSSKNLYSRLSNYFRILYLTAQSKRGSVICKALLLHGYDNFTLQIVVLGPAFNSLSGYSKNNIPDYVILQQHYLCNFAIVYNSNRFASSAAYTFSTSNINVGKENPSFKMKGVSAFAWNNIHSEKMKDVWSKSRGKTRFFVYLQDTFTILGVFPSASKLSEFFQGSSKRFKSDILKFLKTTNAFALRYGKYIISTIEIDAADFPSIVKNLPIKSIVIQFYYYYY